MESLWKDKQFEEQHAKLVGEMWKLLPFSQHTLYHKIDKTELVVPRTMGHFIQKKYQVAGHYLSTKNIMGCPELHFWRVSNCGIRSYDR